MRYRFRMILGVTDVAGGGGFIAGKPEGVSVFAMAEGRLIRAYWGPETAASSLAPAPASSAVFSLSRLH
jgi:hypothetical protein